MIRLNDTSSTLKIQLAGSVTTNQAPVIVSYSDKNDPLYNGNSKETETDDTNLVVICDAPQSGTIRDIDTIQVYNYDTAPIVIFIYKSAVVDTLIISVTLQIGDQLSYTHAEAWKVIDKDGNIKTGVVGPPGPPVAFPLTIGFGLTGGSYDGSAPITIAADLAAISPLTTKGDIFVYSTVNTRLGVGTDGYVLTADSTAATGMKWAVAAGASGLNAVLTISNTTLGKNIVVSSGDKILFNGGGGSVFEAFTDGTGIFNFYDQTTATTAYTIVSSVFQFGTGYQVSMDNLSVSGISILGGDVNVGLAGVTDGTLVFKNAVNANTLTLKSGTTVPTFPNTDITYILPVTDPTAGQVLSASLPIAGVSTLSWATVGTGTVTSVTGTLNRITSTGGATPIIDISAAYDALWQPIDADLTAIAALGFTSTSFLKKTGAGTWALDTNDYLNETGTTVGATTTIQEFTTGIETAVINGSYILGSFGTGLELTGSTKSKLHLNHSGADITELGDADIAGNGTRLVINDGTGDIGFYGVGLFEYNGQPILTDSSTATLTNKSGLISQWTNDAGYLTSAPASTLIVGSTTITGGANGRIPYNSSGFYQESANLVWDSVNSQLSLLGAGTASLPTIGIGTTNLGFYMPVADELGLVTGGTARYRFSGTAVNSVTTGSFTMRRAAGAAATPTYAFNGTVNTGMWLNGTSLAFSVNGVNNFNITTGNVLQLNNPGNTFAYSITPSAILANYNLTLPAITANDTFAVLGLTQTLTNKTMTGVTNTLTASLLKSATTEVSVSAATAPTNGQVLTATSSTTATWQTPSGGSGLTQQQVEGLI